MSAKLGFLSSLLAPELLMDVYRLVMFVRCNLQHMDICFGSNNNEHIGEEPKILMLDWSTIKLKHK